MKIDEIAHFFCLGNCLAFTTASENNIGTKSHVQKTARNKAGKRFLGQSSI